MMIVMACASAEKKEGQAARAAAEVTREASLALSLSSNQTKLLEEEVYCMYESIGKDRAAGKRDADVLREAHSEFKARLEKCFGRSEAAEILAWYYNYCNEKNNYETEY